MLPRQATSAGYGKLRHRGHDNVLNVPKMIQDKTFQNSTAILNKFIKNDPGSRLFLSFLLKCVLFLIVTCEKTSYFPSSNLSYQHNIMDGLDWSAFSMNFRHQKQGTDPFVSPFGLHPTQDASHKKEGDL